MSMKKSGLTRRGLLKQGRRNRGCRRGRPVDFATNGRSVSPGSCRRHAPKVQGMDLPRRRPWENHAAGNHAASDQRQAGCGSNGSHEPLLFQRGRGAWVPAKQRRGHSRGLGTGAPSGHSPDERHRGNPGPRRNRDRRSRGPGGATRSHRRQGMRFGHTAVRVMLPVFERPLRHVPVPQRDWRR